MEARIKCIAGVRSVRGGKRDIISRPVTGRDFLLYIHPPILADNLSEVYRVLDTYLDFITT